jgi:hypothetical protein
VHPDTESERVEIIGLISDGSAYAVRLGDASKPQVVTRAYLHKHALEALLDWYEANLVFTPKARKEAKKKESPTLKK